MALLAFLASPMPTPPETETNTAALPTFKRRWWYSSKRLDARPVIWSLDNRPNDWQLDSAGQSIEQIVHIPSLHRMWSNEDITMGRMRAECSCSGRDWQILQRGAVCRAIRRWKCKAGAAPRVQRERLYNQFAAHFIR